MSTVRPASGSLIDERPSSSRIIRPSVALNSGARTPSRQGRSVTPSGNMMSSAHVVITPRPNSSSSIIRPSSSTALQSARFTGSAQEFVNSTLAASGQLSPSRASNSQPTSPQPHANSSPGKQSKPVSPSPQVTPAPPAGPRTARVLSARSKPVTTEPIAITTTQPPVQNPAQNPVQTPAQPKQCVPTPPTVQGNTSDSSQQRAVMNSTAQAPRVPRLDITTPRLAVNAAMPASVTKQTPSSTARPGTVNPTPRAAAGLSSAPLMSPRSAAIFRPKQPPRQLAPIDQEMMDSKLHELQPSWRLRVLLERLRLHLGVLLPVETRRAAQSGRRDSLKNSPRGDNPAANTLTTPRAKSTQFNLSTDSTVERVAAKLAALQDTQTPRSSTIKHFDDGTDDAELDAAFLDFDDTPEVDAFRAAGDELHISTPSALLAVMRETERLLTAHEHLENVSARAVSKANATQQRLASLESQRARLRLDHWHDTQSLLDSISACEKAAVSIDPSFQRSDPVNIMSQAAGGEVDENYIHGLIGLKFARLDELIFVLRRRIAQLEGNEPESVNTVLQQFGSVTGLLNQYERVCKENTALRQREVRFMADPLLRRRKVPDLPADLLKLLVQGLQNELGMARSLLASVGSLDGHPLGPVLQRLLSSQLSITHALGFDQHESIENTNEEADTTPHIDIDAVYESMVGPIADNINVQNALSPRITSPRVAEVLPIGMLRQSSTLGPSDAPTMNRQSSMLSMMSANAHNRQHMGVSRREADLQKELAAAEHELKITRDTVETLRRENARLRSESSAEIELKRQANMVKRAVESNVVDSELVAAVAALPDSRTSHIDRNRRLLAEQCVLTDTAVERDRIITHQMESTRALEHSLESEKRRNHKMLSILLSLYNRHAGVHEELQNWVTQPEGFQNLFDSAAPDSSADAYFDDMANSLVDARSIRPDLA